ncbi:ATP phosphoribosyltransferase regulatory subunit [Ectothiorhodospiraceae bacterium BW-2]|nr:ATP phosphoribosyltransferase regulatory subunit [Ectothiorhodospiraceae bacterium BW-2]
MNRTQSHQSHQWVLPQGIEELLPAQTRQIEQVRQRLLQLFNLWGYNQVITPLVEYIESLLIGTGAELDLQTFKLIDQQSGRMLGIRADMTPQVARIDAHRLHHVGPNRLCYIGTVLHTLPGERGGSRTPRQVGAELYGHAGVNSDIEIIHLMLTALQELDLGAVTLDLGHVGIFRTLMSEEGVDSETEAELRRLLSARAVHEVSAFCRQRELAQPLTTALALLCDLQGGEEVLERAGALIDASAAIAAPLDYLRQVVDSLNQLPGVSFALHLDLAELRGYHYHNGLLFSAYQRGSGQSLAQGGRYDGIGEVFGRHRAATGFSMDLKQIIDLTARPIPEEPEGVWAPAGYAPALQQAISKLRSEGVRVVQQLGEGAEMPPHHCRQQLVFEQDQWRCRPLESR